MINPFEDESASYLVLINDEGQHSLWPKFAEIPAGWTAVCGPDSRDVCIAYVEAHWTDLRPQSLVRQMDSVKGTSQ